LTVDGALAAVAYARAARERFLHELGEFLAFPSVASQPRHARDVAACAAWLANHLRRIGVPRVQVVATPGSPVVIGEWRGAPGRTTLLVYGHYDVQPVEPLSDWQTPPFRATVAGEHLAARGASDDKGPLFAHVKALEACLATGAITTNVVLLFEGEEEIGSPHLVPFLMRERAHLGADAAVVSDTRISSPLLPALIVGLRGALSLELELTGPPRELHSGQFGGAVREPLAALVELLAGLHDTQGRITISGFYDSVRPPTREPGPPDAEILRAAGVARGFGERGFTAYEQTTIRPSLTITGVSGGGTKAVIPARARATIGLRLVPDQDPDVVERLVRMHLEHAVPPEVLLRVRTLSSAAPVTIDPHAPVLRAAPRAYARGFGAAPVLLRSGGTIPVVSALVERLRLPTVLMGFALPDDGMHGPNEKLHLPTFFHGIETSIAFLDELAALDAQRTAA
jgi:acetylornithine deacetylase/succinyl-diaminopimelate desuccinylase-like protein